MGPSKLLPEPDAAAASRTPLVELTVADKRPPLEVTAAEGSEPAMALVREMLDGRGESTA